MNRNPESAQDKIRRGHAEDMEPAGKPEETKKSEKKEMQNPLTRVDPNCEGEYWDEEEESETPKKAGAKASAGSGNHLLAGR
jgi:hypothetical protein